MSVVREVLDGGLCRRVALKCLRPQFASDAGLARRFVEEAQITAQLEHPDIPPIYRLHSTDASPPAISMRKIQGAALSDLLPADPAQRLAPGTLADILEVLIRVCEALAYAHSRGVVHRDVKPSNVMIGPFGEVYLVDWGIARLLPGSDVRTVRHERSPGEPNADEEGMIAGSPRYMAPELAAGRHELVDARTDVFLVGAMLYEVLTGRPPFAAESARATVAAAASGTFPSPREVVTDHPLPPRLVEICLKAMARKRDDRFRSARDLGEALEQFLRGTPSLPVRRFSAGETVVREGESASAAFIIVEGSCIAVEERDGSRRVLRTMTVGDVFGEAAIFSDHPRSASVEAVDDLTVQVVDRAVLTDGLGLNSWLGTFVQALALRFLEVDGRLRRGNSFEP